MNYGLCRASHVAKNLTFDCSQISSSHECFVYFWVVSFLSEMQKMSVFMGFQSPGLEEKS
jgi:hypothetical protein